MPAMRILNRAAVLIWLAAAASAPAVVTIDWVVVGNPGNAADPADGDSFTSGIQNFGSVGYSYRIGKYEVTNEQYHEFLNAVDPTGVNPNGIYNTNMGSNARGGITFNAGAAAGSKYTVKVNMDDKPVNYASHLDAQRFANWLHNGQGSGSTETGAYTTVSASASHDPGALFWIPTEDEWYKAAYYDPTKGGTGGYWLYPTGSDSAPTVATANSAGDISNPGSNVANHASGADWNSQNGNVTTVGSAGLLSASYYGTFDQGGNVAEWNEAIIPGSRRGARGGVFSQRRIVAPLVGSQ